MKRTSKSIGIFRNRDDETIFTVIFNSVNDLSDFKNEKYPEYNLIVYSDIVYEE